MNQKMSVNEFIRKATNEANVDPKAIKSAIDAGDISKLTASMSKADMEQVQAILNDKNKLNEILNSPMGKALFKHLSK
ncbi:MAG: hypothetical protein IKU10_08260 [Clostridia bacterium]|nr:hypothetical protein [Clostridia bacterium]